MKGKINRKIFLDSNSAQAERDVDTAIPADLGLSICVGGKDAASFAKRSRYDPALKGKRVGGIELEMNTVSAGAYW
jgi:hypothetical protein